MGWVPTEHGQTFTGTLAANFRPNLKHEYIPVMISILFMFGWTFIASNRICPIPIKSNFIGTPSNRVTVPEGSEKPLSSGSQAL